MAVFILLSLMLQGYIIFGLIKESKADGLDTSHAIALVAFVFMFLDGLWALHRLYILFKAGQDVVF